LNIVKKDHSSLRQLHIIKLETCASTNDYLKKNREKLQSKFPVLITSAEQISGRGREGREWVSLKDRGIYSSFGVILDQKISLTLMPIICGISVIETLQKISNQPFYIKWPNDIFYEQKKIAGILIENIIQGQKVVCIAGIGMNINHVPNDFPHPLKKKAISLRIITGEHHNPNPVINTLSERFFYWLQQVEKGKYPTIIQKANLLSSALMGKKIQLHQKKKNIEGVFIKINERGGIILENKHGQQSTYFYGEICTPDQSS
jgi:BirA family biotin operon repressor/biotin-[acetyl-CoA-carboxylase] ligase